MSHGTLQFAITTASQKMGDTAVGVVVSVVGICSPNFGCTCEYHSICGTNVYLDMLVRFKSVLVDGGKC
jgi:hypothetical protein